jgi:hypothetical protein
MSESKPKPDYTIRMIRDLLGGYADLEDSKMPLKSFEEYGVRINKQTFGASFEKPAQLKTDIDNAMKCLKPTQLAVVIAIDICHVEIVNCEYWLNGKPVKNIEYHSLRLMRDYLNGNKPVSK